MTSHFYQKCQNQTLVSLTNLSPKIKVYPYYYHQIFPHALPDCYLREEVAKRLVAAAEKLPKEMHFVVLDGWRPYELQLFLYEKIREDLLKEGETENINKFVASPSKDIENASPHMTGGAIDLTIATQEHWLEMGTAFDEFIDQAQTNWYENQAELTEMEKRYRDNREILKQTMEAVGFVNYKEEWWHYDYGNRNWAKSAKQIPKYKGILTLS